MNNYGYMVGIAVVAIFIAVNVAKFFRTTRQGLVEKILPFLYPFTLSKEEVKEVAAVFSEERLREVLITFRSGTKEIWVPLNRLYADAAKLVESKTIPQKCIKSIAFLHHVERRLRAHATEL